MACTLTLPSGFLNADINVLVGAPVVPIRIEPGRTWREKCAYAQRREEGVMTGEPGVPEIWMCPLVEVLFSMPSQFR
jgi:hypothetical protein